MYFGTIQVVDKMNFAQFAASCVDAEAINNTDNVKKHGTVIRPIVKFVIVFFVYFVANIVLALLFEGIRISVTVVTEIVGKGFNLLVAQAFGLTSALLSDCGLYAVITVAGIVGCGFVIVVRSIVKLLVHRKKNGKTTHAQSRCAGGNVCMLTFRHHIQFLS